MTFLTFSGLLEGYLHDCHKCSSLILFRFFYYAFLVILFLEELSHSYCLSLLAYTPPSGHYWISNHVCS